MAAEFEALLRTTPDKAAEIICRGVDRGKARILVGPDAYVFDALARVAPTHYYDVMAATGEAAPGGLAMTEPEMIEHRDVLIVGAGLSGIGAAHHLQAAFPARTYAILEARDAIGGTWDLFRYPGVRSDSDMFTLGYRFRPWTEAKAIADGPSILGYVRATAAEAGIDKHIRFGHRVTRAELVERAGAVDRGGRTPRRRDGHADLRFPADVQRLLPLRPAATGRTCPASGTSAGRSCTRSTGRRTWTTRGSGSW